MTKDKLRDIFQSPFSNESWHEVLMSVFSGAGKNCQLSLNQSPEPLPMKDDEKIDGYYIGDIRFGVESVKLYTFHIKDNTTNISRNRLGLHNMVNYLAYYVDAAIVVYFNEKEWRVSYIYDKANNAKRFTYSFGDKTLLYRTAVDRFRKLSEIDISTNNILDVFSVEALSKDFFKGYRAQYNKFVEHLGPERKENRDYVKKLLGRLVFLQFLQKKGWMGVPLSCSNWQGGDTQYTQNLVKRYENNHRLLSEVLKKLFFDTLNSKREGDATDPKLGDNIKIPYLNGGLFDKDSLDNRLVDFPYDFFAELMDFFSQYNFTIDENDPNDAEVGIDPEMLGHIFENLLEDNKDKGAFYTPKEIVQYMCRESLSQYLKNQCNSKLNTAIEQLIFQHIVNNELQNAKNANELTSLLVNVKICDPAIGSGAFPMGILNEIFALRKLLFGHTGANETFSPAQVKKEIIQNTIYGVDIEQGAVDIARLRFWLSLVVDETVPQPLPNLDYKIMCGNSLLSRFAIDTPINEVFAEYNRENKTKFTLESYRNLVWEYTNTSSHEKKTEFRRVIEEIKGAFKTTLDKAYYQKRLKIEQKIEKIERPNMFGGPSKEEVKELKLLYKAKNIALQEESDILTNQLYENSFEWRFELPCLLDDNGDFIGFDIVIGNPPYVQLQANGGMLADQLKNENYETFTRTGDIYCLFYERGIKMLRDGGIETFITSNKWMRAGYGEKTRAFFAKHNPLRLVDLGSGIFESATVDTNILIIQKNTNKNELLATLIAGRQTKFDTIQFAPMNINGGEIWSVLSPLELKIKTKIEDIGTPLKDWDIEIYRGILTGFNEAFIIDTEKRDELLVADPRSAEIIKPILRGRDIKRYSASWAGLWLINTHNGVKEKGIPPIDVNDYPAIKAHLDQYSEQLMKRQDKGDTHYNLRNCAYVGEFESEKIVWKALGLQSDFTYIVKSFFNNDKANFLVSKNKNLKYLTAIFNSKLFFWQFSKVGISMGDGFEFKVQYMKLMYVAQLPEQDQQPFINIVDKILDTKHKNPTMDTSTLEDEIDKMVYNLYSLTEEEIKIIESKSLF